MRRLAEAAAAIMLAAGAPVAAQTVDASGVRSGNVRIDASGVHTGGADVTARGVVARGGGMAGGRGGTTIDGNGQTRSIACDGGSLVVNGNHNRLTVAGCSRVTIAGNDNIASIAFTRPGSLTVPGNRNTVTWHAPRDVRVGVTSLGTRNAVTRRQ